jgi:hypothetical protein
MIEESDDSKSYLIDFAMLIYFDFVLTYAISRFHAYTFCVLDELQTALNGKPIGPSSETHYEHRQGGRSAI